MFSAIMFSTPHEKWSCRNISTDKKLRSAYAAFLFVKLIILILQVRESTEALEGAEKGKSSQAHVFLIDGAPLVVISSKKW